MVSMANIETKRCDNLSCVCEIPIAAQTCSDYCRRAEQLDELPLKCECGHDACVQEMQRELTGTMGSSAAP
jgi:hypothetical protein